MSKLVLGNGDNKVDDGVGLNYPEVQETDVAFNLERLTEEALPFSDNSFDKVEAYNILEHLTHEAFVNTLEEIARVTRQNGYVKISGPHHLSVNSPAGDHFRGFSEISLNVFSVDHDYPTPLPQKFKVRNVEYRLSNWFVVKVLDLFLPVDLLRRHVPNCVEEIVFTLEVVR